LFVASEHMYMYIDKEFVSLFSINPTIG